MLCRPWLGREGTEFSFQGLTLPVNHLGAYSQCFCQVTPVDPEQPGLGHFWGRCRRVRRTEPMKTPSHMQSRLQKYLNKWWEGGVLGTAHNGRV